MNEININQISRKVIIEKSTLNRESLYVEVNQIITWISKESAMTGYPSFPEKKLFADIGVENKNLLLYLLNSNKVNS